MRTSTLKTRAHTHMHARMARQFYEATRDGGSKTAGWKHHARFPEEMRQDRGVGRRGRQEGLRVTTLVALSRVPAARPATAPAGPSWATDATRRRKNGRCWWGRRSSKFHCRVRHPFCPGSQARAGPPMPRAGRRMEPRHAQRRRRHHHRCGPGP